MSGYENSTREVSYSAEPGTILSPAELRARVTAPVSQLALAIYEPNTAGKWDQTTYIPPNYQVARA